MVFWFLTSMWWNFFNFSLDSCAILPKCADHLVQSCPYCSTHLRDCKSQPTAWQVSFMLSSSAKQCSCIHKYWEIYIINCVDHASVMSAHAAKSTMLWHAKINTALRNVIALLHFQFLILNQKDFQQSVLFISRTLLLFHILDIVISIKIMLVKKEREKGHIGANKYSTPNLSNLIIHRCTWSCIVWWRGSWKISSPWNACKPVKDCSAFNFRYWVRKISSSQFCLSALNYWSF